jgi:phosphate acetyltransferase
MYFRKDGFESLLFLLYFLFSINYIMNIIDKIKSAARSYQKTIVLPESNDERVLKAADQSIKEQLAKIILIGNPNKINADAKQLGLQNIAQCTIVDPTNHPKKETYTNLLFEIRKDKGLTMEQAAKLVENPLYLGCLMIKNGDADGEVAGSISATSDVVRPALQIIKTSKGLSTASSCFLMIMPDEKFGANGIFFYGDCGVVINPNERELAEIAVTTAQSAKSIAGIDPVVAMLSFSTKGSAKHEMANKVINATAIAKEINPSLIIDGELQADAALVESVGKQKAPDSQVVGKANVLIFPDLGAGNIAYKLTQRLANAIAIGPILQGIAKPVNDLSRGCSVEDIVISVAITANQAAAN